MPPHRIAHLGLGYCPEERGIFASLSCEENLLLPPPVADGGMSLDEIYAMFPNLRERRASPGRRLSGGEQQMLSGGAHPAHRAPSCCCSTRSAKGWRRSSCRRSGARSARCEARA